MVSIFFLVRHSCRNCFIGAYHSSAFHTMRIYHCIYYNSYVYIVEIVLVLSYKLLSYSAQHEWDFYFYIHSVSSNFDLNLSFSWLIAGLHLGAGKSICLLFP